MHFSEIVKDINFPLDIDKNAIYLFQLANSITFFPSWNIHHISPNFILFRKISSHFPRFHFLKFHFGFGKFHLIFPDFISSNFISNSANFISSFPISSPQISFFEFGKFHHISSRISHFPHFIHASSQSAEGPDVPSWSLCVRVASHRETSIFT